MDFVGSRLGSLSVAIPSSTSNFTADIGKALKEYVIPFESLVPARSAGTGSIGESPYVGVGEAVGVGVLNFFDSVQINFLFNFIQV